MIFDPMYLIIVGPGMLFALIAAVITKSTFSRYSHVGASSRMTGAEAAQAMLDAANVRGVRIEPTRGMLSDHFDPRANALRLSEGVYGSQSLAAIGIACHEAGHAIQKATKYGPLGLRTALVPMQMIGSQLGWILLILGISIGALGLVKIGILLFSAAIVFAIVTLPVEWDASARAKQFMVASGVVTPQESVHAAKVLNAAFLTYVAAAVIAILQLLYFLMRAGLLGGRRD
jgi:Zn-dependent membrane protease YugP